MANSAKARATPSIGLAVFLAALLAIAGPRPAAAFGMGGLGHGGGLAGPARGFAARPRAAMMGRHRGNERVVNEPRGEGRRGSHPGGDGKPPRHHRIGKVEIHRGGGSAASARTSNGDSRSDGASGRGGVPRGENRFARSEVIVEFAVNASRRAIRQVARRYALTRLDSQIFTLIGTTLSLWHIGGGRTVPDIVGALQDQRIVARAQPNYLFTLDGQANKTASLGQGDAAQYVLSKLQVSQAQLIATGRDIPVALIDSEIDTSHPDIAGSVVKSYDALGGDSTPQLHGTEMAGAIAAHGKLLGIAPGVRLLAARAFDSRSSGTSFAIYKSLQWAADNNARVINMSFAGPADPTLLRLLAAAAAKNIVLVAAAGNDGPNSAPLYPAADPNVIAVTATDVEDHVFKLANRGRYIAVAAPGVDILALAPRDSDQLTTGTSVAAAHVSGIAALLLQRAAALTPTDIRAILKTTAKPLASDGNADSRVGLVNAYRALSLPRGTAAGGDGGHEQAKR